MYDKDFINYLAKRLLNSGEDCCSICAYTTGRAADCDNLKAHDVPDDVICTKGIRAYAEKHSTAKPTKRSVVQVIKDLEKIELEVKDLTVAARNRLDVLSSALARIDVALDNLEEMED